MDIIDASVMLKWFIDEEVSATRRARKIRDEYLNGNKQLLIPFFLYIEIANVLSLKKEITDSHMTSIWSLIDKYGLKTIFIDISFLAECVRNSRKYKISVYDAIYVTLAIEKECQLITADKKLVKAVNEPFVKIL